VQVRDLGGEAFPDTYPRLARVRRLLEERWGSLDTAGAREILRDHAGAPDAICRHLDDVVDSEGKRLHSVFSLVMDLERRTLEVTNGPPCSSEYHDYDPQGAALAALPA
jgi:isopenicillin-N N-acyltransferase-like protein